MEIQIAKLATAENSAIHLHPEDNVAVARVPLSPGTGLHIGGIRLVVRETVPAGHKVALRHIRTGEFVRRYGEAIGRATTEIEPGSHVHVHNLAFEELEFAYEFPAGEIPIPAVPSETPTFLGYPREDGRVGTRNYIAIVA
ncbi:MAG: altronate dehydratase family protein, partial [Acidobacteria bacterium]|nr:altronate dehydratase family protein [Acidobacteriota bacterium]